MYETGPAGTRVYNNNSLSIMTGYAYTANPYTNYAANPFMPDAPGRMPIMRYNYRMLCAGVGTCSGYTPRSASTTTKPFMKTATGLAVMSAVGLAWAGL